jgi:predicted ATP-dependent endonuclease of OLD family
MKFDFKNLGPIKTGEVELGDLTVICGRNNVGKTYISHSIWGLLNQDENGITSRFVDVSINDPALAEQITPFAPSKSIKVNLSQISVSLNLKSHSVQYSKEGLKKTFNTDSDFFKETVINLNIRQTPNKDGVVIFSLADNHLLYEAFIQSLLNQPANSPLSNVAVEKIASNDILIFNFSLHALNILNGSGINVNVSELLPDVFILFINQILFPNTRIITSERTGIALFLPSLDRKASEIVRAKQDLNSLFNPNNETNTYPTYGDPIQDNIDRIRAASSNKNESKLLTKNPIIAAILSELIGGSFNAGSDGITFTTNDEQAIPLHVVSSSAKSLFLIEHYIKREAKTGDLLIIDEPELNLHLDNQVKMAHLIAALINAGIKILITTHSDHLLRELNNLIMLSSDKIEPQKYAELIKEYQIDKTCQLQPEQVKAFVVSKQEHQVFNMPVSEIGIKMDLFNQEINQNNRQTKDIYFALMENADD